ncbi:carboxypeptidase-like regulatory domain-containing protein [Flavipsychrobacter stenotrophus]|nr:carboxypeptidase-like regulatory domain-containing protein [Flavipsychrobacter stenotrophus]
MRMNFLSYCLLSLLVLAVGQTGHAQTGYDNVIQINGVIMTADSLRAVPNVTVQVKNKNRGVESEYSGVFSIVCYKGDTLEFSSVGYRPKEYVVKKDIGGNIFSMIQLMVQDTFFLPETIIRPLPSGEGFDYAFLHWRIPNDQYEIARRNTDAYILRALAYTLPKDGHEAQSAYLQQQAREAVYYGQQKPMNILNPLAWGEFFEAWKRGDFRKKSNPYLSTQSSY